MTDDTLNRLTHQIIGYAFKVSNTLGAGFLEKVYENALVHELRLSGLSVEQQKGIQVTYAGVVVGEFFADILVNDTVIVELKSTRAHDESFTAQCLNYLKATGKPLCLLLNFGQARVDIRRYRSSGTATERERTQMDADAHRY